MSSLTFLRRRHLDPGDRRLPQKLKNWAHDDARYDRALKDGLNHHVMLHMIRHDSPEHEGYYEEWYRRYFEEVRA